MSLKDRIKRKKMQSAPQLAPKSEQEKFEISEKCVAYKNDLIDYLKKTFDYSLFFNKTKEQRSAIVADVIEKYLEFNCRDLTLSWGERQRFIADILEQSNWFGPLLHLLEDPCVSVIYVNGPQEVFVEKNLKIIQTSDSFTNEEHLKNTIKNLINIGEHTEWLGETACCTKLSNGTTIKAIFPPLANGVGYLVIKKFDKSLCDFNSLIKNEFITDEMAKFLNFSTSKGVNIIITGAPFSGKTTLLAAIGKEIERSKRIVLARSSEEVEIKSPSCVTLNIDRDDFAATFSQAMFLMPEIILYPDVNTQHIGELLSSSSISLLTTVLVNNEEEILPILSNSLQNIELIASKDILTVHLEKTKNCGLKVKSISQIIVENKNLRLKKIMEYQGTQTSNGSELFEYESTGYLPDFVTKEELDTFGINEQFFDKGYEHEFVRDVIEVENDFAVTTESELDKSFRKTKKLSIKSRFNK